MEQYHLINLYSMRSWMRWSSPLLPLRASPGENECQEGETALRNSGFELMKALDVWRVEEGLVRGVMLRRAMLRRAIGCAAAEKQYRKHKE